MKKPERRDTATTDEEQFTALVEEHWPKAFAYATQILGHGGDADDAVQEALMRMWMKRSDWHRFSSLPPLLFRIVRNVCVDQTRRSTLLSRWKAKRQAPTTSHNPSPSDYVIEADLAQAAREAIASLPERRRHVFLMIREGGLSHAEVAEALGLRPQTVANHMGLALKELRERMKPYL